MIVKTDIKPDENYTYVIYKNNIPIGITDSETSAKNICYSKSNSFYINKDEVLSYENLNKVKDNLPVLIKINSKKDLK